MIVHIHYSSAAPPSSSGRRYDFGMNVVTFSHFMDSESGKKPTPHEDNAITPIHVLGDGQVKER